MQDGQLSGMMISTMKRKLEQKELTKAIWQGRHYSFGKPKPRTSASREVGRHTTVLETKRWKLERKKLKKAIW